MYDYSMKKTWEVLNGYGGLYWGLFFAALIFIYIEKKNARRIYFSYIIIMALTLFNPMIDKLITDIQFLVTTYFRTFWLIPMAILIAYSATKIIVNNKKNIDKIVVAILVICAVMLSGVSIKDYESLAIAKNKYKIPNELVEIIDIIKEDTDEEQPTAMFTADQCVYARQYDSSLKLTFGRSIMNNSRIPLSKEQIKAVEKLYVYSIGKEEICHKTLQNAIELTNTGYIVSYNNNKLCEHLVENNFEIVADVDGYSIFKTNN